jgi:hypothetical protein
LHQSCRNGPGLRDQRQIARWRRRGGKARIELRPRHEHAEAIGTDEAHAGRAGVLLTEGGKRTGAVAEPGRDDDADRGALARRRGNGVRYGGGRHRNGDDIGHLQQGVIGFDRAYSLDLVVARIDQMNRARETGAAKVFEHGAARRCFARRCADDGDRSRREKRLETVVRH